jgi:cytochrome c2
MQRKVALLAAMGVLVVGCGSGVGSGNASEGQKIFNSLSVGSEPGCVTCHSLEPGKVVVGPSLAGIATDAEGDAAERGISTEAMLKIMITDPNDEVVEGFLADTMPQDFGSELSKQQLDDLIAFLMTLK